jgi:hypothetical protein
MKMAVLLVVAHCRVVEVYGRLGDACCLLHQGFDSSP